jgi:hypothetical protein
MKDNASSFGALATTAYANRSRSKSLPPMQNGEVERLVADFLATRDIAACPARYAAPVEQRRRSALLTMRPYIAATATAVGLLALWAALVPFMA